MATKYILEFYFYYMFCRNVDAEDVIFVNY